MPVKAMEDLFVEKLRDIHDAERRILRALPKMVKAASSEELSSAFEEHLQQTEGHVTRLEQIFDTLGKPPTRKSCHGMMGILEEGEETMGKDVPEAVLDAALIAAAQEVEHYEIGAYGTLRTWAELMGQEQIARLLQETLQEEEETDEKLTQLAEPINAQALEQSMSQEQGEEETVGAGRRSSSGHRGGHGRSASRSSRSTR